MAKPLIGGLLAAGCGSWIACFPSMGLWQQSVVKCADNCGIFKAVIIGMPKWHHSRGRVGYAFRMAVRDKVGHCGNICSVSSTELVSLLITSCIWGRNMRKPTIFFQNFREISIFLPTHFVDRMHGWYALFQSREYRGEKLPRGIIVRTKQPIKRKDGSTIKFDEVSLLLFPPRKALLM